MSLINQVLRDLQGRQVAQTDTGLQAQISPVASGRRRFYLIPTLLIGVFLVVVGMYVLPLSGVRDSPSVKPIVPLPAVAVSPPVVPGNEQPPIPVNRLAAVRLQSGSETSRLVLEFSQVHKTEPVFLAEGRQLKVLLPDLVSDIRHLPQPPAEDSLISSLDLLALDNGWQLLLRFKTEVQTEKLLIAADALHGERWAIDVFAQVAPVPEVVPSMPVSIAATTQTPESKSVKPVTSMTKQDPALTIQEQASGLYQSGIMAEQNRQMQSATQYWKQTLSLVPEHIQARKKLIIAMVKNERSQADELFNEGLVLHDPLKLRKWYARTLLPVAGVVAASAVLDKEVVNAAVDAEYRALQAGLWQQAGEFERSGEAYRDLLRHAPHNSLYRLGLAISLDQQVQTIKADEAYRMALNDGLPSNLQRYALSRIEALTLTTGVQN